MNEKIFRCDIDKGGCGCCCGESERVNDNCPHCDAKNTLEEFDPYE